MTVTPLSLTACCHLWPAGGFLSISLSPVAVRPTTPCQRPVASLYAAASPTGTPGLRAKEPVGNAELWLPGPGCWEERAQETQGPDPQAPSQVRGTSPSQPASHRWQPGAPTVEIPGLPGERRGSQRL
ncbi:unnamed protein product [Pipistrellus nathusii]|uniref:Uncharacterized protein n=1 Tax=Pipistrellus nathusii TaxID=59473 RepID=A0ABP0A2F4_PIPNA